MTDHLTRNSKNRNYSRPLHPNAGLLLHALQTRAAIRCMGATSLLPSWTGYTCVSENTHAREERIWHVLGGSHLQSKDNGMSSSIWSTVVPWCE
jgi:hypothetical protein